MRSQESGEKRKKKKEKIFYFLLTTKIKTVKNKFTALIKNVV